jgi:hypothetical protein
MIFRVLEPAEIELKEAYSYYNSRLPGLGDWFLQSFKDAVLLIAKIPPGWRKISANTRGINFDEFPYLILYVIDNDTIVITYNCHNHRNPEHYKKHYRWRYIGCFWSLIRQRYLIFISTFIRIKTLIPLGLSVPPISW